MSICFEGAFRRRAAAHSWRKTGGRLGICRLLLGLLTLCAAQSGAVEEYCSYYQELYRSFDEGAGDNIHIQSKCYPNGTVKYSWSSSNAFLLQIEYQCHNLNTSGSSSTDLQILSPWSSTFEDEDYLTVNFWQPSSYCNFSGCYRDFPARNWYYVEKVQCTTPAVCGAPSPLANGNVEGPTESALEGSTVVYQCNPGFAPQTRHSSECTVEGVWSWEPGESHCKRNCTEPTVSEDLILEFPNGTTEGAVVWYECSDGLAPEGRWSSVCSSEGAWSPDPAIVNCSEPELMPTPSSLTATVPIGSSMELMPTPSSLTATMPSMDPPLSKGSIAGIAVGAGAGVLALTACAISAIVFVYKCSRAKGIYQRQEVDMDFSPVDPEGPILATAPSQVTILEELKTSLLDVSAGSPAGTPSIPTAVIACREQNETGFEMKDYGRLEEGCADISACSSSAEDLQSERLEDVQGGSSGESDSASFTVNDGDVSSSENSPYCSGMNDGARQSENWSNELTGIEANARTLVTTQDETAISHQSLQHADTAIEAQENPASPVYNSGLQHLSEMDIKTLHLSGQQWQEQNESRYLSSGASSTGYVVMLPGSL